MTFGKARLPGLAWTRLLALLGLSVLLRTPGACLAEDHSVERLARIEQLFAQMRENREEQAAAWTEREEDQRNEQPPPLRVRLLEKEHSGFERQAQTLVALLRHDYGVGRETYWLESQPARRPSVEPLLEALAASEDPALIDALAPVAGAVACGEPRAFQVLSQLAAKLDPCPSSVIDALVAIGSEDAALLLFELGLKRANAVLLAAAGASGQPAVIASLIEEADKKSATARLCLDAIQRLAPPAAAQRVVLAELVAARAEKVRSVELRAFLIAYLGLFRSRENLDYFQNTLATSKSDPVRCAAIGALGQLGREAGAFLLEELRQEPESRAVRDALLRSLGMARYRPATPHLIEQLSVPDRAGAARGALSRIAGRDLGEKKAMWRRWWQAQPEARAQGIDRDGI